MDDTDINDTYVAQLKEMFDSCDMSGNGMLNELELNMLCEKLHIIDHVSTLVHHLLEKSGRSEVRFEDFKECFVAVLMQSAPNECTAGSPDKGHSKEESADREISPKFTLGRKKYGRRSRPASTAEEDSSASSSPAVSRQNSIDQTASVTRSPKVKSDSTASKRPVSPSYSHQPPSKTGRMTNSHIPNFLDSVSTKDESSESITGGSGSEPDTNPSFVHSPVQYLQETWKKLGIGKDGYLNVEELTLVCEHIGMDMTEEVVAQLFEKLDCDQDGQISFEEFLQGLFQHGDPEDLDSSLEKDKSSLFQEGSREDHQISTSFISGIFSCIDPNNTGYAEPSSILELWESLELPCGPQLLEDMGFNSTKKISLSELTSVLEEELNSNISSPLGQLAFLSYQNELHFMRQNNDQMRSERDKLKANIEDANTRAALLAQEVDDNHAKLESALHEKLQLMEKKYQEQIRELIEELQQEREAMTTQSNSLKLQLQAEMQAVREEDAKLKSRLNVLEQENCRLEQELQEATEKYLEAEKMNEVLQKELAVVPSLKKRLADLESHHGELQERHHQSLLQDLEKQKSANQELQDKIDELMLEIENLQQQNTITDNSTSKNHNRSNSWLSDYKKAVSVGYKRRGSESSSEDNSDDESPTIGKIRRTFSSSEVKHVVELEIHDSPNTMTNELTKSIFQLKNQSLKPTSVDILMRDLFVERTHLVKKYHLAMERQQLTERSNSNLRCKCRILSQLLHEATLTAFA